MKLSINKITGPTVPSPPMRRLGLTEGRGLTFIPSLSLSINRELDVSLQMAQLVLELGIFLTKPPRFDGILCPPHTGICPP